MEFEFLFENVLQKISVEKKGDRFVFRHQDSTFEADLRIISANSLSLVVEGRSYLIHVARDKNKKVLSLEGEIFVFQKPGEERRDFERGEDRSLKGKAVITAPMPGKVIQIKVAENETVRKNQTLAIVEAMKMENELKAAVDGIVKKIYVSAGDLVDSEKALIELEPKT